MIHTMYIDFHYDNGRRSGVAFHGTLPGRYRRLGSIDSHGCIRMKQKNAASLFDRITGRDRVLAADMRWGEVPRFWMSERGQNRAGYTRDGTPHPAETLVADLSPMRDRRHDRLGRGRTAAGADQDRLPRHRRHLRKLGRPRRCLKRATSFRHSLSCGDEVHNVVRGFCVMTELNAAQARPGKGALVISRGVTIIGALSLDGQVLIEGTIDGEVRCSALQITERGEVEGLIVADKVEVLGEFSGAIYARELVLGAGCNVEGQIYHHKLILEEGCYFEGQSRRHGDPLKIAPLPVRG